MMNSFHLRDRGFRSFWDVSGWWHAGIAEHSWSRGVSRSTHLKLLNGKLQHFTRGFGAKGRLSKWNDQNKRKTHGLMLQMCSCASAPDLMGSKGFVLTQALRIRDIFTWCKLCHSPSPFLKK